MQQGPVAQLVSAPPCHGGGRGFESRQGRQCGEALAAFRPGSSVGMSVRLKSGRSAVRSRPWPPNLELHGRDDCTLWMFQCVGFLSVRLICGGAVEPVEVCGYVVESIGVEVAVDVRRDGRSGAAPWFSGHIGGQRRNPRPGWRMCGIGRESSGRQLGGRRPLA